MSQSNLEYVTKLADQLSADEKASLIEHLTKTLRDVQGEAVLPARPAKSLRGIWQEHFSTDFDVDAALSDIRNEWQKEWPEVFNK
jgi:hypothetical protein